MLSLQELTERAAIAAGEAARDIPTGDVFITRRIEMPPGVNTPAVTAVDFEARRAGGGVISGGSSGFDPPRLDTLFPQGFNPFT